MYTKIIEKCDKKKNRQHITMLYLKMFFLQLADVFENFVEKSKLIYGINPLYTYSAPGYTWKAGLKRTKIKLDFIKDEHLLLLLENNIRGGISSVMGDRHVISDINKLILYIGANNLYGWAMSQFLPPEEFEKLPLIPCTEGQYTEGQQSCNYNLDQLVEDLLQIPDDNEYGFFIECVLENPVEIKAETKNSPMCPFQTKSDPEFFTLFMNSVNQPYYKPTSILMCDVTNKTKYMTHDIQTLYQYEVESNKDTYDLLIQTINMVG